MMTPVARLMEISYDGLVAQRALYAAAKLGIADALADGEVSSDHVAQTVGGEPESTYRLMRTLASIGILSESAGRQFRLTPTGELLGTNHPQSMRQWIVFSGEPAYLAAWGEIVYTIETGRPAWDRAHSQSFFEYMASHAEAGRVFDEAMTSLSHEEADAVADAYDFSQFHNVVDVGGGHGKLLVTLLKRYPALRGVVFDQPQVVKQATGLLAADGLGDRLELAGGDFFVEVPAGGDAYLLKYILHDWDDAHAVTILASCRRASRPDGKLLLVETVVPGPDEAHFAKLQDLEMLVLFASRERTEEQYRQMLIQAGFRLERVVQTAQPVSVIEAVPI